MLPNTVKDGLRPVPIVGPANILTNIVEVVVQTTIQKAINSSI